MKRLSAVLVVMTIVVSVLMGSAWGQFAKPEEAIAYRQAVMVLIGQHFGRLAAMVKGDRDYDLDEFANNAALVETFAGLPWEAFMEPGSDEGDTALKSEAFKNKDTFEQAAQALETETSQLAIVAEGGDLPAIKEQFGRTAQSCKNCHSTFRK
jgi:cytochrome c556